MPLLSPNPSMKTLKVKHDQCRKGFWNIQVKENSDDDNVDDDDAVDVAACGNSASHKHVYICDCHSHAGDDVRWMS